MEETLKSEAVCGFNIKKNSDESFTFKSEATADKCDLDASWKEHKTDCTKLKEMFEKCHA